MILLLDIDGYVQVLLPDVRAHFFPLSDADVAVVGRLASSVLVLVCLLFESDPIITSFAQLPHWAKPAPFDGHEAESSAATMQD